jgi:CheY-like chemotaxis protein
MPDKPLILCVDDESHILHVVSLKLRNAGFEVVTADDGEEGLAAAFDRVPDVVITDFQMPFLTGLELSMELKKNPDTSHIPVLMLTARGFSLSPQQLDQTNIVAVLNKPFSPRDVLARVQALLPGRGTGSPLREAS